MRLVRATLSWICVKQFFYEFHMVHTVHPLQFRHASSSSKKRDKYFAASRRAGALITYVYFVTLRAKLSGAVYCYRSCLWRPGGRAVFVGGSVGLLPR